MIARVLLSAVSAGMLAVLLSIAPAGAETAPPKEGAGATTAAAEKFRWRWEKVVGPGEHPWTMTWRSNTSGPYCEHTGEGQFCGCSNTSACGRYDRGQEITTAPFGCDKPERWRLRCNSERQ